MESLPVQIGKTTLNHRTRWAMASGYLFFSSGLSVYHHLISYYHMISIWFPYFPHKEMLINIGAWRLTDPTPGDDLGRRLDSPRRRPKVKDATDVEGFCGSSGSIKQEASMISRVNINNINRPEKLPSILSLINKWKKKSVSASETSVQPATSLSPRVFVSFNDNHQKIEIQQDPRIDNQHWKIGSWPSGIGCDFTNGTHWDGKLNHPRLYSEPIVFFGRYLQTYDICMSYSLYIKLKYTLIIYIYVYMYIYIYTYMWFTWTAVSVYTCICISHIN